MVDLRHRQRVCKELMRRMNASVFRQQLPANTTAIFRTAAVALSFVGRALHGHGPANAHGHARADGPQPTNPVTLSGKAVGNWRSRNCAQFRTQSVPIKYRKVKVAERVRQFAGGDCAPDVTSSRFLTRIDKLCLHDDPSPRWYCRPRSSSLFPQHRMYATATATLLTLSPGPPQAQFLFHPFLERFFFTLTLWAALLLRRCPSRLQSIESSQLASDPPPSSTDRFIDCH